MRLTFSNCDLKQLMADAEATWPNGTRTRYGQRDTKPGFWLAGDNGVYLMANSLRSVDHDGRPFIAYAQECNPHTCDDWWQVKRRSFGGDDGVDFVDKETVEQAIEHGCCLFAEFEPEAIQFGLIFPISETAE